MDEYKVAQLKSMLQAETGIDGGYGAHLTHWSGKSAPINIDAEALKVLIAHYESRG
jgi:hypothetical protein